MIKNTSWESLVWIIIWVFILAFIILWVTNLLINSRATLEVYENKKIISVLKNNTETVIKKINTDVIRETELFYLRKNNNFMEYEVLTWSTNSIYKYIDKQWNTVDDIINFEWDIYSRQLWLERDDNSIWDNHQIIKISIKKLIKK
mgnify:FL=1|jgi:ABC-type microcin C transport system permease subunit YejE